MYLVNYYYEVSAKNFYNYLNIDEKKKNKEAYDLVLSRKSYFERNYKGLYCVDKIDEL